VKKFHTLPFSKNKKFLQNKITSPASGIKENVKIQQDRLITVIK